MRWETGAGFQQGSEMMDTALAKSSELLSRVEAEVSSEDSGNLIRKEQVRDHDQ